MAVYNSGLLPHMSKVGMNTALVKFGDIQNPMNQSTRDTLLKWGMACKETNIAFYPIINFWGGDEPRWYKPKYHYFNKRIYKETPCPIEDEFFKTVIYERFVNLALLSLKYNISGLLIDLEMYGANKTEYPDYCLCDHCFEKYLQGRAMEKPLSLGDKAMYLKHKGLEKDYRDFFTRNVELLFSKVEHDVHAINPNLRLGALHLDRKSPFAVGVAKGLGTKTNRALAFTEATYQSGYTDYVTDTNKRFKKDGIEADIVVGLWQDKIPPSALAAQCYYSAINSAGYWIYTMQSFAGKSNLPFKNEEYWNSYRVANTEILKYESNTSIKTSLKLKTFEAPVVLESKWKKPITLKSNTSSKSPIDSKITIRFTGRVAFNANAGENVSFHFKIGRIKSSKAAEVLLAIYAPDGSREIIKHRVEDEKFSLKFKAKTTGTYTVEINTGGHLLNILKSSHCYVIDASRTIDLYTLKTDVFFKPLPMSDKAVLWFSSDGGSESYTVEFYDSSQKLIKSLKVWGQHKIEIPLMSTKNILLRIRPSSKQYFGDVELRVISGVEDIVFVSEKYM